MSSDYAVHSNFLIHWTGGGGDDIDSKHEPGWHDPKDETFTNNGKWHPAAPHYLQRLRDILQYGLWMTEEETNEIIGNETTNPITIPNKAKVCFTELKLSQSRIHANKFGRLGIGFKVPYVLQRHGRPVIYCGFRDKLNRDDFLTASHNFFKDENSDLLGFFKPMTGSPSTINNYYSESEWRIIARKHLLDSGKIIDPRNPANKKHNHYW